MAQATAYDTAANLYDTSADWMQQLGKLYQTAAPSPLTAGAAGTQLGQKVAGMLPGSITQEGVNVGSYGPANISGSIANNMNDYLNPFYNKVLKSALGQLSDQRDVSLNQIGANATSAGAFGGSRQGIVEGQVYSDYGKQAADLAANLQTQNYQQALAASQTAMGMQLDRGATLTGLQTNADLNTNANNANLAMQLAALKPSTYLQGYGTGETAAQGAAGLNFNQQLAANGQNYQQRFNAAQGLGSLGNVYYGVGNDITDRQTQQGDVTQQIMQSILSGGANQFSQFLNSPYQSMNLMQALLSGDPRSMNTTGTATQSYQPGFFDFLSLGMQTYGATR